MDKKKLIIIGSIVLIAYIANTVVNNKASQAIEDAIKPQLRQLEMESEGFLQIDSDKLSVKTSLLSSSVSFYDFSLQFGDNRERVTASFDEYTFSADLQALQSLAENASNLENMDETEIMQFSQDIGNAFKDASYDLIGLEVDFSFPYDDLDFTLKIDESSGSSSISGDYNLMEYAMAAETDPIAAMQRLPNMESSSSLKNLTLKDRSGMLSSVLGNSSISVQSLEVDTDLSDSNINYDISMKSESLGNYELEAEMMMATENIDFELEASKLPSLIDLFMSEIARSLPQLVEKDDKGYSVKYEGSIDILEQLL
tara:strand:+ start:337 stop:1275 length:939 start_codon:yes stop_codon:yes gene_type:complete